MDQKVKSSEAVIKAPKSIARSVSNTIIVFGITAELFSLILIIVQNKKSLISSEKLSSINMIVLIALIIAMLIHHYFIMNNFKRIDSSKVEDLREVGFGNWVCNRNWEDYLRFPIFILFAVLTGEIQYIFAVGFEIYTNFTHTGQVFDIGWVTTIFVTASFILAFIMVIWNISGLIYDHYNPILEKKIETNTPGQQSIFKPVINPFPFKSAVWTFLLSDLLAFLVWGCFFLMLILKEWDMNDLLKYFAFFYIILILLRALGPRIITVFKVSN